MPLWLSNANFNLQCEFAWHSLKDGNSPNLSLLPQKKNETVRINTYFIPELRVQVNFYFFMYVLSGRLFSGWLRLANCHMSDSTSRMFYINEQCVPHPLTPSHSFSHILRPIYYKTQAQTAIPPCVRVICSCISVLLQMSQYCFLCLTLLLLLIE